MLKRFTAAALILCLLLAGLGTLTYASASEYYSDRTPLAGSGQAKRSNVSLAIEAVNGVTIPYGGRFSFNETVGARTQSRGYQTAPNGRGASVTGGGVAQVATTLYLALQEVRGRIDFDPVQTYGSRFTDSYVLDGSQAVIVDYDAGIDFSFTNYADAMTIEMWANDSYVYCSITVGTDSGNGNSGADFFAAFPSTTAAPDTNTDLGGQWFIAPAAPSAATAAPTRALVASASLNCGGEENVLHNVELAADCVSDTTLQTGDVFSFNEVVGPRTKSYGFKRATNGRGKKVTGGGVAQVASALWLAVKDMDDISIVEKFTYGKKYNQHYVASSSDAIVTDYSSGRDFSFKYTGGGSLTFYTYVSDGWLYCDVYRN